MDQAAPQLGRYRGGIAYTQCNEAGTRAPDINQRLTVQRSRAKPSGWCGRGGCKSPLYWVLIPCLPPTIVSWDVAWHKKPDWQGGIIGKTGRAGTEEGQVFLFNGASPPTSSSTSNSSARSRAYNGRFRLAWPSSGTVAQPDDQIGGHARLSLYWTICISHETDVGHIKIKERNSKKELLHVHALHTLLPFATLNLIVFLLLASTVFTR